jgi:hypothetical protein
MTEEPLGLQLATLRNLLAEVDSRLARAPATPPGLEDLKRSVDTLRTNMWAILSAGKGPMAPVRVERLKLRRAIDGIQSVRDGLSAAEKPTLHPEHIELQLRARELADEIGKLR